MGRPRFLADTMLGSLARKLRLLGIDTAYSNNTDHSELKYIIRSQDRILLTRHENLAQFLGKDAWLVQGHDVREEFFSIAEGLSAAYCKPDPFSLCLDCNEPLVLIDPSEAEGKVPPYIHRSRKAFSRCPSCGKIFWEGTHRERMEKEVEWMKEQLKD